MRAQWTYTEHHPLPMLLLYPEDEKDRILLRMFGNPDYFMGEFKPVIGRPTYTDGVPTALNIYWLKVEKKGD